MYDHYKNYSTIYNIVNIHWPEAIFDWVEPTEIQLIDLEKEIIKWKKKSILVYTKHDTHRNKGTTLNFDRLFYLIEKHTDVFIHLGIYSKRLYEKKYPHAIHEIIYHPLFKNSFKIYPKTEAKELLKIKKDALVIIAPGKIRTFKERDMVLKSFKALPNKNKVLIATNMRTELPFDFPGRVRLKKFFDLQKYFKNKFKNKYHLPDFLFNYNNLNVEDFSLRMSAADVVLIPRIDLLNSGNIFLGLTFKKVIVGPAIGNIEEQLKELGYPIFNPKSLGSVIKALEKGIILSKSSSFNFQTFVKYQPSTVAKEYDRIFSKHIK